MKFKQGEMIIYGDTGVCRVEDVSVRSLPSGDELCYKLNPLYQSCTIYTPVEQEQVFMRPVISEEEANSIIDSIPECQYEICTVKSPRELSGKYDEIIRCFDCEKLVQLIKSIREKKERLTDKKKKLSAVDERYMKKAQDMLYGEFAAALGISKSHVLEYIKKRNGTDTQTAASV